MGFKDISGRPLQVRRRGAAYKGMSGSSTMGKEEVMTKAGEGPVECHTHSKRRKEKGRHTRAIGGHLRHGGILHHSCRTSTSRHHGSRVGRTRKSTTAGPHGVLLVIHHRLLLLRLVWTRTRLHLRILTLWGAIVRLARSIAVAISR